MIFMINSFSIRNFFFLPRQIIEKPNRLFFLDGFRSLALLFMVITHCFKTWINPVFETPFTIALKTYITRIPAPSFFFLVGASYILSRNSRLRRGMTRPQIFSSFVKRSLVLFIFGYVYKLVDLFFGIKFNEIKWTIDVLNVIAVSLFLVSLWDHLTFKYSWNPFSYFPAALAMIIISPYMFLIRLPEWVPLQLAWYVQGIPPNAYFTIFPFASYSFFGAFVVERLLKGDAKKPFLNLGSLLLIVATIMFFAVIITRLVPLLGTAGATTVFYMQAFSLLLFGMLFCHFFQKRIGFGPLLIIGSHTMIGYWLHAKIVFIYYKQYIGVSGWGLCFWMFIKTLIVTFFALLIYDKIKLKWFAGKKKTAELNPIAVPD